MKQKHVYAALTRYSGQNFLYHINKLQEINMIFTSEFRYSALCSCGGIAVPLRSLKG